MCRLTKCRRNAGDVAHAFDCTGHVSVYLIEQWSQMRPLLYALTTFLYLHGGVALKQALAQLSGGFR